MIPLYREQWFTFRFGEDRLIPRFHLDGLPAGTSVAVHAADPDTLQPIRLLATAAVGEGGWVDLARPMVVRAGDVFVVFPDKEPADDAAAH